MEGPGLKRMSSHNHGTSRQLFFLSCIILMSACASSSSQPDNRNQKVIEEERTAKAVDTHVQLAVGYLQRGQFEIALEKIEIALEHDPKSADAHTVAGAVNERIGRYDQADYHYHRAVKLKPNGGGVLNNYGQFLCKSEKVEEAEEYFRRAVDDPFYKNPATALGNACSCLVNSGQMQRAERYCRDAIERDAQAPDSYYHLARVFYQLEQYMKARAFLQRYDSVGPNTPESLMLCVRIETKLEALDLASSCRDRLLKGFPRSLQARELEQEASR